MFNRALSVIGLALVLADSASGQEVDQLVKELKVPAKRIQALEKITALGPKAAEAGEALVEAMMDKSPVIRKKAAAALEAVDPEIHRHVVTILIGQSKDEALKAIAAMGKNGKGALPVVLKILSTPIDISGLHHAALATMRKIAPDDTRVSNALLAIVSHQVNQNPPPFTRLSLEVDAAESLRLAALKSLDETKISAKEKVPALVRALKDRHCVIPAIEALGRIGPDASEALVALKRLKTCPIDAVRDAATEAVRSIERK